MEIPIAKLKKVKRRNGLGRIYYKLTWVWDVNMLRWMRSDNSEKCVR